MHTFERSVAWSRRFWCARPRISRILLAACALLSACAPDRPTEVVRHSNPVARRPAYDGSNCEWSSFLGPAANNTSDASRLSIPASTAWSRRERWRRSTGSSYASPVASGDWVIDFSRREDREWLEAIELSSGKVRWKTSWPTSFRGKYEYSDGPYSTPWIERDRVLAVGAEGRLICVALHDGAKLWERDLQADFGQPIREYPFGAGLLVRGDRVYLNVGAGNSGAGIVAFDLTSGATVWTATDHAAAFTTPCWWQGKSVSLLLTLTDVGLVALDPATGRERWNFPFRSRVADSVTAVTPLVLDDHVLLVAGPGAGAVCLRIDEAGDFSVVWKDRRLLDSLFNKLVPVGDLVFGFRSMRQGGAPLRAIRWRDGTLAWESESELDRGQMLAADGWLIAVGERGHFGTLALKDRSSWKLDVTDAPILDSPCYSSPALHRGLLLVRDSKHLFCFDVRAKSSHPTSIGFRGTLPSLSQSAHVAFIRSRPNALVTEARGVNGRANLPAALRQGRLAKSQDPKD